MSRRPHLLSLRAQDPEDYAIMSAILQDALIPITGMGFAPDRQTFDAAFRRFTWEHGASVGAGHQPLYNVWSGLHLTPVHRVLVQGIDRTRRETVLEFLTMVQEPDMVTMVFAGGAMLRLIGTDIKAYLEDLARPEPTNLRPKHED